jgi:hypothetical protein
VLAEVGGRRTRGSYRTLDIMAIELTDEEFDLLYRALRATAEQTVDDDTRTLVELEDDAWDLVQRIAKRTGYPHPTS